MTPTDDSSLGDYYERQIARTILLDPTARSDLLVAREHLCDDLGCTPGEIELLDEGIAILAKDGVEVYDTVMAECRRVGKAYLTDHPHARPSELATELIFTVLKPRLQLDDKQRLAVRYAPRFVFLLNELLYHRDDI